MLAVWCLVFAAVGERFAVSGKRDDGRGGEAPFSFPIGSYQASRVTGGGRSPLVRDASLWDWFSPEERGDSSDIAAEVTYPKRLVQQMESKEEMSHGYLDTRVKNTTGGTSVSIDHCL
ncbi:unnamed protein product [Oncorhynchus mykiss]|uniref:Uncharacterized protein n=1 Tax=Oncorhynchus mykiss TaxID=8022 RepID=A0A060YGM3_ONCMY|nr:unnamed protein product [Oncorhynchus mykiss]